MRAGCLSIVMVILITVSIAAQEADILALYSFEKGDPRDTIVAAWLMEEGSGKQLRDFMGHFDDGEIMGNSKWVDGKFGKALKFDGSTVYVRIPFNPKFQVLNKGDFTTATWFKTDLLPADRGGNWLAGLQQIDLNGTGRTWTGIWPANGENRTYTYLSGGPHIPSLTPKVGEWFHLAVVVKEGGTSDTIQLYFNGKQETDPAVRSIETCEGDFLIGSSKTLGDAKYLWEGLIDELVIINKALTEGEINQLMNNGVQNLTAVGSQDKLTTTWGYLKSYQ